MSSESLPFCNPAGHAGLLGNALALMSAVVEFFRDPVCAALIQIGCSTDTDIASFYLFVAVALCVMGYGFLIVSTIIGLAYLLGYRGRGSL